MPIDEARKNDEVIALADSQMLRWIDELNGVQDADAEAKEIRRQINALRDQLTSQQSKREIKRLYSRLDTIQFQPDYLCVIMDKKKDYHRACKGFNINGIKYKRLLGTNGGIKNKTIVFVSDRLYPELSRRVENDRDSSKSFVTAKLEAYKALTCSASIPVSPPRGVLVVNDALVEFRSDVIYLNDEDTDEPIMEMRNGELIESNATDGCGIMLPSLAARWGDELRLRYVPSGVNTRFSFEKGMVFTFDFLEFAERVAKNYIVKDAWGDEVDIRDVELILTTSMVKLWSSYKSCSDYLEKSYKNGYTFAITKTCPEFLERQRTLNYQFIQSYELSDDDIEELIRPTIDEFTKILGADWRDAVLYLKGFGLNAGNVATMEDDYIKAAMIDPRVLDDPFVQNNIYRLIRHRINSAKIGVIKVHGNYSIVSADPYLLCQSIFGLEKTGLLKAGEIYNSYWSNTTAERLVCFRAPMTCHNNIRSVIPSRSNEAAHWYRYMTTCTVFNAWDTAAIALNGCDFDGDMVMLTDNAVLVNKHRPLPALMCIQRKAESKIPTESDFIRSNIESFGDEIGATTNDITSMFPVLAGFSKGSLEHETLSYRIMCGQLYQQNAIDKAKGIVCKPMPYEWHDRHAANTIENEDKKTFYRSILADKKPYFMKYIYPKLMVQYNTYIKNTTRNSLREFQLTVDELRSIPETDRTERQSEFLRYYDFRMPLSTGDCVMNKICKKFEQEFDRKKQRRLQRSDFDYSILKSDHEYTPRQFSEIKKLYLEYNKRLSSYSAFISYERVNEQESELTLSLMNEEFRRECDKACPNRRALCNAILDICYTRNSTKRFAWNMCGTEIIRNLLENNQNSISFPMICQDGDIEFGGERFKIHTIKTEVNR